MSMAGGELRRSYTQMEFSLNRDRGFNIRPQLQHVAFHQSVRDLGNRRRYSAMPATRVKHATMEIYRPPNGNAGTVGQNGLAMQAQRLNVHAKEFTMNATGIQPSRSSGNLIAVMNSNNGYVFPQPMGNNKGIMLQQSKSSGNILNSLQHSKSSGNILHNFHPSVASGIIHQPAPRVHFARTSSTSNAGDNNNNIRTEAKATPGSLKRSKSLTSADALKPSITTNHTDLGTFPPEINADLQQAIKDPNEMSARSLMQLVKHIVDRVTDTRRYAEPAAKLCINIIEKEKKETFLESLLNTCQQWYQEREKVLRATPAKYPPFMAFLNEMYCQLKRSQLQLKTHYDGVPPQLLLLTLLSKCCLDCLKPTAQSMSETECLFFVLTSIGRDLEQDLPKALEQVISGVRDVFLAATTVPQIRKTLLQLIELRAAKWQLPASAVMYYYPGAR